MNQKSNFEVQFYTANVLKTFNCFEPDPAGSGYRKRYLQLFLFCYKTTTKNIRRANSFEIVST